MLMLLEADKVSFLAPLQLTASLMLTLPLVPVPPALLKIVTLLAFKLAPKVAPVMSLPDALPTVKSVGSMIQLPPVP